MRAWVIVAMAALVPAAPAWAQTERGYLTGLGAMTKTPDTTSGDVVGEGGVRIAPHVLVFGDLGRYGNLQPSAVQPTVDSTTTMLASSQGLDLIGTGRVPALYSVGGVRYEIGSSAHATPYVLGGVGVARLTPTARFTFSSGTLPDGSTPTVGADVTDQIVAAGDFTKPAASTARMFTLGGGVDVPVAKHWTIDAGYRYARLATTTPLNAQGASFGFGYRF